jgi:acetyltransferase-like isoleucine patch superfamily enzyme
MEMGKVFRIITNSKCEENTLIYTPSRIANTKIGYGSYVAAYANIQNTTIGRFCSIGPNFFCGYGVHPLNGISTAPMFYSTKKQNGFTLSSKDKIVETKPIEIGNDVFIGANVTVLDGVIIGDGAVVGAGAVVVKDVPPYAIAVGVPAKVVKYRFNEMEIENLLEIKWWDWPQTKLNEVERDFFNIDEFILKNKSKL